MPIISSKRQASIDALQQFDFNPNCREGLEQAKGDQENPRSLDAGSSLHSTQDALWYNHKVMADV